MRAVLAALAVLAASGCATLPPHTTLPAAPTADAPYAERAAYVKKYMLDAREQDHMFLHGGDRIYYPEDLKPAVDVDSPTAKAIDEHLKARAVLEEYAWVGTLGSVTATVGLALFPASLIVLFLPLDDDTKKLGLIPTLGGGVALMALGLGVIGVNVLVVGEDANVAGESADRAARTYPQALLDRLGVNIDADGNIVDNRVPLGGLMGSEIPAAPQAPAGGGSL
jgi:hypothetical protein